MRRLVLAFLVIAPASCSDPTVVGPDGKDCPVSLAEATSGCPATFDGTEAQLPPCRSPSGTITSGTCGDLVVLTFGFGLGAGQCFYDPQTNALVGGRITTDYNEYCGGRSFAKSGGRVTSCGAAPLTFIRSCAPDAGAPD